jgi:hypothetical protein
VTTRVRISHMVPPTCRIAHVYCSSLAAGAGRYTKVTSDGESPYVYIGEWHAGRRSGLGECRYSDGTVYSGQWREEEWSGDGSLTTDKAGEVKSRYEGQFQRGKQHGLGSLTVNDTTYEGKLILHLCAHVSYTQGNPSHHMLHLNLKQLPMRRLHDKRTTCAYELTSGQDAAILSVPWNGLLNVSTMFVHNNPGSWSEGRPVANSDCQWGIRYRNGDHYVGTVELVTDGPIMRPHGRGTFKYDNSDVYTGHFQHGLRAGQGTCVFANGESYVGLWSKDAIDLLGSGKLTLADGTVHDV